MGSILFLSSGALGARTIRGPLEFKFNEKALIAKARQALGSIKAFEPEEYDLSAPHLASIVGKGCEGEPIKWMMAVFPGKKNGSANAQCYGEPKGELICGYGISVLAAGENLMELIEEYRDLRNGDGCEP